MKADEIAALLPGVFRNVLPGDETLAVLLAVMEALQDPIEERLGRLDRVFDALVTTDRFVQMLSRWVDLEWLYAGNDETDPIAAARALLESGLPIGALRLLVDESHRLSRARGTAHGLIRFLEIATGVRGFVVDEGRPGAPPFHFVVSIPKAANDQMGLIERIVNAEKPAYTTWEAGAGPA